jgi:predicted aspartyl protease
VQAFGYFNEGQAIAAAPMIRVGVGFGRDRVVGMPALVDTGSDLCVFPASLAQGLAPEKGEPVVILELADGRTVTAALVYPSVTAGNLRETEVASAILPDAPAILGRSFLNRLDLRIVATRRLVRLQSVRESKD